MGITEEDEDEDEDVEEVEDFSAAALREGEFVEESPKEPVTPPAKG